MKNLAKSLSKFHDLMGGLEKDASNPFFKSRYVTLDNVLTSIKQPLKDAGLTFVQTPHNIAGQPALETIIIDTESGESLVGITPIVLSKQDPQGQGSAITYMRRYMLVSMLGLSTDTDDDGNVASRGSQVDLEEVEGLGTSFRNATLGDNDRV